MEHIDEYYRSLKKIYDYLVDWKEPPTLRGRISGLFMWLALASGLFLLFTLIPVLPIMLSIALPRLGKGLNPTTLLGIYLDPSMQYWLLCLIGSVTGVTMPAVIYNRVKPPPSKPEYSLSPDQVSFVLLYTAFEELRLYLIDNLTEHVDKATRAVERLLRWPLYAYRRLRREARIRGPYISAQDLPPDILIPEETPYPLPTPAMANQVQITSSFLQTYERYHWFRMEEQTVATLQALTSFRSKIYTRLVAKQDLPRIKILLEHLARWVYSYLPELEASRTPQQLQALRQAGDRELTHFTEEMDSLTEYEFPAEPVREPTRTPSILRRIMMSESSLARFLVCFVVILILTSALSFVAVQVFGVQRQAAVTMTISTSVVGAATLAVVPGLIKGERKT